MRSQGARSVRVGAPGSGLIAVFETTLRIEICPMHCPFLTISSLLLRKQAATCLRQISLAAALTLLATNTFAVAQPASGEEPYTIAQATGVPSAELNPESIKRTLEDAEALPNLHTLIVPGPRLFGLAELHRIAPVPGLAKASAEAHSFLIWAILGATILHVSALIYHTVFTDRRTIRRIL